MKKTNFKKVLSLIGCTVLIAAIALFATACGDNKPAADNDKKSSISVSDLEKTPIGEGEKHFIFTVTDKSDKTVAYDISTDKETVGEALLELGLIDGDDGPYGIYVKTVNGITLDFNKDGKYWAFYEGDKYAAKGADLTKITEGTVYSFKAE